ncbi:MAG: hypothetical protein IPP35_00515 [Elusimicrobia bacterium]|nr:hypothetical protein [Elusimicrobiota bacterium]
MTENPGHSSHPAHPHHGGQGGASPAPRHEPGRGKLRVKGPLHAFIQRVVAPFAKKHKVAFMAIVVILGLLLMIGGMKLFGLFSGKGPDTPKKSEGGTLAVNVVEMKAERFVDPMVAVGSIQGGSEIPLRFETEGVIDLFEFREGDKLRKGDVIARLNQRDTYLKLKKRAWSWSSTRNFTPSEASP